MGILFCHHPWLGNKEEYFLISLAFVGDRPAFFFFTTAPVYYLYMTLQEQIKADFMTAFKARNTEVADTLRLLMSALQNRGIEKKGKGEAEMLTDEETLEIIRREAKRRKEAITLYTQGNRQDLVDREAKELKVLETYLPTLMSEEDIKKVIEKVVAEYGAVDAKDFGKVMSVAMKELKGKADATIVTRLLKEKIA